jgi:hypothetical protein
VLLNMNNTGPKYRHHRATITELLVTQQRHAESNQKSITTNNKTTKIPQYYVICSCNRVLLHILHIFLHIHIILFFVSYYYTLDRRSNSIDQEKKVSSFEDSFVHTYLLKKPLSKTRRPKKKIHFFACLHISSLLK